MSTDVNKGDVPSSPPGRSKEIVVTHESVSNVVQFEHEVKIEGNELEQEMGNSDKLSENQVSYF